MLAKCPAHLILDLITQTLLEQSKSCEAAFNVLKFSVTGVPNLFLGKGRNHYCRLVCEPYILATKNSVPNLQNYCILFLVYVRFTNVAMGHGFDTPALSLILSLFCRWPRIVNPIVLWPKQYQMFSTQFKPWSSLDCSGSSWPIRRILQTRFGHDPGFENSWCVTVLHL